MKRVFLVHGWEGNPRNCWFPDTKRALENRGFKVKAIAMPTPATPRIASWVAAVRKAVGNPDEDTYLIGHSIGCQAIMRYLQDLKGRIGGAVFVAGFFTLKGLETSEEKRLAKPWVTGVRIARVKKHARAFTTILSDDDPFVSIATNAPRFRQLGRVIRQKNMSHFDDAHAVIRLPIVTREIERISR